MTFERIILLGEQYPEGFDEAVNINGVWVCRRGLREHLVRHVVAGAHGPSVGREGLGVGQSDQAEIAHEILAIDFKEVAGFDVSMPDSVLLLQPRQRLRNRTDRGNDVLDARCQPVRRVVQLAVQNGGPISALATTALPAVMLEASLRLTG